MLPFKRLDFAPVAAVLGTPKYGVPMGIGSCCLMREGVMGALQLSFEPPPSVRVVDLGPTSGSSGPRSAVGWFIVDLIG